MGAVQHPPLKQLMLWNEEALLIQILENAPKYTQLLHIQPYMENHS